MTEMTCTATADGFVLIGEHFDDCDEPDCRGCFPCVPRSDHGDPLGHCVGRHCREHLPADVLVCPRCVGKARADLARIVELHALSWALAREEGNPDPETSRALALAAEAADPAGLEARRIHAYRHLDWTLDDDELLKALELSMPAEDDIGHPLVVLGTWDLLLREEYGPPTTAKVTVAGAANFLDTNLDRLASDADQDWQQFAAEVRACRVRLEAAFRVLKTPEKGAPCPACPKPKPNLEKRYGSARDGSHDYWRCSGCGNRWSDAEYTLRVGSDYGAHAERMTASEIEAYLRVPQATLRSWVKRGEVRKMGRDSSGRALYDAQKVRELRGA